MSLSTEKTTEQEKHRSSGFQEDLELLRKSALFHRLDTDCLKLLAMLCKRVDLVEGDHLMMQGEDDGHAYIIISGRLSAIFTRENESQKIRQYFPGDLVGGCALLGRMPRIFTLEVVEKTTALRLKRDDFQKVMHQFPTNISLLVSSLIAELAEWDRILLERLESGDNPARALGVSLL